MTLLTEDNDTIEYSPRAEFGKLWAEAQNEPVRWGARFYSAYELLRALEPECTVRRIGGMVWQNENITSTQAL